MRLSYALLAAAALSACAHPATNTSSAPPMRGLAYVPAPAGDREQLPDEQIQQVLNRLAFGPRPGEAEQVRAMGVDRWIDAQLHPERIDDRATDATLLRYTTLQVPTSDIVESYKEQQKARRLAAVANNTTPNAVPVARPFAAGAERPLAQRAVTDLQSANLTRAVMSERQLSEVMVEFWENHFSVFSGKGQTRLYLTAYDRDVIRPHALGKFRDLLGAVAQSSAMLFFLDNWESQADSTRPTLVAQARGGRGAFPARRGAFAARGPAAPVVAKRPKAGLNENYGRELMELHTLGVDGGYTQHDVTEVSRAFTGWTIQPARDGAFLFRAVTHDAGQKVVLGHTLAAGRGMEDGNDVLDILARAPATARFITTKLARHFISDDPPVTVVDRCSKVFTATDGDIRQTLGCVITSPEFFSRAAYRAKVKTPFEVVASGLRAVNAGVDATPRAVQAVATLGAPIFGHQTPEGWPDYGEAWMNTGAIVSRINFGLVLAADRVPGVTRGDMPELALLKTESRQLQVDGVVNSFFGGSVSPETREILMSGTNPMAAPVNPDAFSDTSSMKADTMSANSGRVASDGTQPNMMDARAAGAGKPDAGKAGARARAAAGRNVGPVNLQGLSQVIGLALGAPEFQRR
jgi:uncharacterized protein (DUF1800 family)